MKREDFVFAAVLLLLTLPWLVGSTDKNAGSSSVDAFVVTKTIEDNTITSGTHFGNWCQVNNNNAVGNITPGCSYVNAYTITDFFAVAMQALNGSSEQGTVFLRLNGVKVDATEITVGDGVESVCTTRHSPGGTDVEAVGDGCTQVVSVAVAAGDEVEFGFEDITGMVSLMVGFVGEY